MKRENIIEIDLEIDVIDLKRLNSTLNINKCINREEEEIDCSIMYEHIEDYNKKVDRIKQKYVNNEETQEEMIEELTYPEYTIILNKNTHIYINNTNIYIYMENDIDFNLIRQVLDYLEKNKLDVNNLKYSVYNESHLDVNVYDYVKRIAQEKNKYLLLHERITEELKKEQVIIRIDDVHEVEISSHSFKSVFIKKKNYSAYHLLEKPTYVYIGMFDYDSDVAKIIKSWNTKEQLESGKRVSPDKYLKLYEEAVIWE